MFVSSLEGFLEKNPFNFYHLQDAMDYKKQLKVGAIPRNIFIDKDGYIRYIQPNFPIAAASAAEPASAEYDKDNYFAKLIGELLNE